MRNFTSEAVCVGHPDKLCDQISDAILDAHLAADPQSRVACETSVKSSILFIHGEVTSKAVVDVPSVARDVIKEIGYDDPSAGFDYRSCGIILALERQSPDIAMGVDADRDRGKELGAGDQGMMFGYACRETPALMPAPIQWARLLVNRLAEVRRSGALPYLRPDGKAQVTVAYDEKARPVAVTNVVVSAQHTASATLEQIRKDIEEEVIRKVLPAELLTRETRFHINPTGRFVEGGPKADSGLTGRKIIVDTYGGMSRHGGGAFSGKDPTKVDRSAAYAARHAAKNIVGAGLAERCELALAYAIGVSQPLAIDVETFGTGRVPDEKIVKAVRELFDFRPEAIIERLDLRRPIYRRTAAEGHFGIEHPEATWERLDYVEALQDATGIKPRTEVNA